MGLYRFPFPAWSASNEPFSRSGRKHLRPYIGVKIIGPTSTVFFDAYLDTGAEFCLFPERIGRRIGVRQQTNSPVLSVGSSISGIGVVAWFAPVTLQIEDPVGIQAPFRWSATVGFTPAGTFGQSPIAGLLGVDGGLDQFQRVEFEWAALGSPEVVIRT